MKTLTGAHLVLLWLGLGADALATRMMGLSVEVTTWDLHTISGYLGLALMAALAAGGSWAKLSGREDILSGFHRFAMPIWVIWFVSYATGVVIGIQRV
jgi:uncharacterized repeat protein (TIGR03987 family)